MSSTAKALAIPITLLVLAIYTALLPWTGQVWTRTGDEPHYLIAADSLVRDRDFDLRNNYDANVYLDWYPSPNLDRQVRFRADGAQFLIHTYGLSILIAPAYGLAGARGVAYFMAALGALLAGQVYLLSCQVTQNWRASALGALVVALAPPLVWYVYLLYPEVAGALCVTVAARILIDLTPHPPSISRKSTGTFGGKGVPTGEAAPISPLPLRSKILGAKRRGEGGPGGLGLRGLGPQLLLGLSLAALPWLSARFIPAALTLAALAVLRLAWPGRGVEGRGGRPTAPTIAAAARRALAAWPSLLLLACSLAGLALFNAALYGHAAATASYTVDVNPGPVSWGMLWQLVRGVLGWLLDHQRGLLVAGPIYFVAFIGFGQWLWRRDWAAVVVGLPFVAALGSTALVGGFWVGIEPAARYLVYVLPPLGAALAYGWVHRRGPWLAAIMGVSLAFSLWTAFQVFRDPLLAQTHDLIGEQLPRLVRFIPALGKPTYLMPGATGDLALPVSGSQEQPLWRAPKGQAGSALQRPAIVDLPFGWYTLQFDLGARGAPADAPVARVLFQSGDHTSLVDTMLYGRDFSPNGQLRTLKFPVFNNIYNQWEQPAGLWIFTTGQAELTLGAVSLPPDPFHSLIVPGLWLAALLLVGALVGSRFNADPAQPAMPRRLGGWAPVLAAAALVVGLGAWSLRPMPRQYPIAELSNFIGTRVSEAGAVGGEAISTAGDEDTPGVLAATGPESWPAGRYRWRLSLKAAGDQVAASTALATVTIRSPRQAITGFPAQVVPGSVPADGRFHTLEVEFDNPIHQALVFELDASGAGPLESQGFEVSPIP
jgi:hypothetical protein